MPKRQKQSKELPGEGRPAGLNFGDFLTSQIQSSQTRTTTTPGKTDDFPALTTAAPSTPSSSSSSSEVWSRPAVETVSQPPGISRDLPSTEQPPPVGEEKSGRPSLPYRITKTKKGGIPVRVESRNKGKKVTVVFNVSGDSRELLKELKHSAGCGGVVREDTVELQGEKVALVEKLIKSKMGWR